MDARDRRMAQRVDEDLQARLLEPEAEQPPPRREEPAPPQTQRAGPLRTVPSILSPLTHVLTEDACDDLARIQPSRWRLRVHAYDAEAFAQAVAGGQAPERSDDDEMHGYVCVQRATPVAHCSPDVLTWLERMGFTGNVVLEWLPPPEAKGQRALRHFVCIPERGKAQQPAPQVPAPPVMRPGLGGNEFVQHMLDRMTAESAELRALIREMQASQERMVASLSEQQRHTINDLRDAWNEQLQNDPRRKIGELVESRVTQRVVDELGGPRKDPFEELAAQLQKIDETKSKLARFFTDPEKRKAVDPLEEKITNTVADLGVMYFKQKMGLSNVSGQQALDIARHLGDLNREGEQLLKSLDGGAAA